ncbi:MAG: hypothetical protein OXU20_00990 [Myxococcales bacterium]|nr:hypothetical protein [Myxococcales bacterium]
MSSQRMTLAAATWLTVVGLTVVASCEVQDETVARASDSGAQEAKASADAASAPYQCTGGSLLFEPRALGEDGNEVIGTIRYDEATGDVYFATRSELYVLRAGGSEPVLIGGSAGNVWDEFWLRDEEILMPSGWRLAPVRAEVSVLAALPRAGGDVRMRLGTPISIAGREVFETSNLRVVGDDVYWITGERLHGPGADAGDPHRTSYAVHRARWSDPTSAVVLYRSRWKLSGLVVAGGYLFVNETTVDTPMASGGVQRILDAKDGRRLAETSQARYGGVVVTGDAESLLVTRFDYEHSDNFGTWHMRPDGSHATRLSNVLLLSIGPVPAISRGGEWMVVSLMTGEKEMAVYTFSEAHGQQRLGCFDEGDSTFAMDVADGRALVGVFRDGKNAIMSFPL